MLNCKKILVPVDFSPASQNAMQFAFHLADKWEACVTLLHVYNIPLDVTHPEAAAFAPSIEELDADAMQRLRAFAGVDKQGGDILVERTRIECRTSMGFAVDEIVNASKEGQCDLIIMGATGEHGAIGKWIGSVSSEVCENAYRPVLLVPIDAQYKPFHHILCATDYQTYTDQTYQFLLDWAKEFVAAIDFVHIYKDETDFEVDKHEALEQYLAKHAPNVLTRVTFAVNDSVQEGILNYAIENQTDLVVVFTRHRGFWGKLQHKSITKKISLNSRFPLLVLHVDSVS